jgi:hypothetical protein
MRIASCAQARPTWGAPLGNEEIGHRAGSAGQADHQPADLSGGNRAAAGMAVNQLTENPGRVTDRGLLCWAVLGERGGGPPSRISRGYDQIAHHSARDLSQRSAQRDAGCLWLSTMLELHL